MLSHRGHQVALEHDGVVQDAAAIDAIYADVLIPAVG